jgi:hypothetical protein
MIEMVRKTFSIENLTVGDTVELLTGADKGFRGIVDQFDVTYAWVMFAGDGEDTRQVALADLKITHKAVI